MNSDIGEFGNREIGPASCNVAPGSTAPMVDEHRFQPCFAEVPEQ